MPVNQKIEKNVLIIDSSVLIIERLINILKEIREINGIFQATDFTKTVGILQEKKTNIVLLDIQLPEKNGIDLLKHIVQFYPEIKVIVLTNLVSVYYQRLCKTLGAGFFIDKSKDFDQIPEIISLM